ncbi:hypothetical protein Tco_0603995 [Tanacetum coccineum]
MRKAQDQRLQSMKEQAYNMIKTKDSRTQRQRNLNKSKETRFKISPQEFKDYTLGEIVSLKYVCEHGSSESMFEQNYSLESKNRCLKKAITELLKQVVDVKEEMTKRCAQYEKDFAKPEVHCISLELKSQNKSSTSVQNGHVLSDKSDEAKIKFDTEDLETINIELEYSVALLLKENEHLKKIYQKLFDSIKRSRVQTKVQTFLKTKQKI